jgi:hypothetical protein
MAFYFRKIVLSSAASLWLQSLANIVRRITNSVESFSFGRIQGCLSSSLPEGCRDDRGEYPDLLDKTGEQQCQSHQSAQDGFVFCGLWSHGATLPKKTSSQVFSLNDTVRCALALALWGNTLHRALSGAPKKNQWQPRVDQFWLRQGNTIEVNSGWSIENHGHAQRTDKRPNTGLQPSHAQPGKGSTQASRRGGGGLRKRSIDIGNRSAIQRPWPMNPS